MQPMVSVRLLTYNHEKYIAQCIEGALMQKTNFPFEILIGEDCSTDGTREIVFSYQQKFADVIRVVTSEKNIGGNQNSFRLQQACRGKYHAMCEGDDYWIDPLKLQKQVDFMEAHPDYSMCCHDAFVAREDKSATPRYYCPPELPERLQITDLFRQWQLLIPTASMLARAEILATLPAWRTEIPYGDLLFRLWCAHHGDIGYLPAPMSVYRVHPTSMMAKLDHFVDQRGAAFINLYQKFDQETANQYSAEIKQTLQSIEKEYRFLRMKQKMGWLGFVLNPDKIVERLREYATAIRRYRRLFQHAR